jgi:hypothetical protein
MNDDVAKGRGVITEAPISVRDVLRLLLAADSYPRLGNHDWREADLLTAEALQKARTAKPRADDPPEFAQWLETLLTPDLPEDKRQEVYFALHDFFDDGPGNAPPETDYDATARGPS